MLVIINPSILKIACVYPIYPGHIRTNTEVRNYFSGIMRVGEKAVTFRGSHMGFRKNKPRRHNHSTLGHVLSLEPDFSHL